jgi:predicted nucleic acid-binding protein
VTRYVLDTNLYVDAARDRAAAAGLVQFTSMYLPQIYLHAVVAQELTIGAINAVARKRLDRDLVQPFERRGRIVVPSYRAWKRSGEIVAKLTELKALSPGGFARSFLNDVLLATSCREEGYTIITRDTADFARIEKVEVVPYVVPWPTE